MAHLPIHDSPAGDISQPTDTPMEGIETKDFFNFATTSQFYDPHANPTVTNNQATIGSKVKDWLRTLNGPPTDSQFTSR
jgi:hypothetical protein